jgi:hypothetical protein
MQIRLTNEARRLLKKHTEQLKAEFPRFEVVPTKIANEILVEFLKKELKKNERVQPKSAIPAVP